MLQLNQLLQTAVASGASDLHLKVGSYPVMRVNGTLVVASEEKPSAAIRRAVEQAEQSLQSHGRVLIRASGTEPVLRVMVEKLGPTAWKSPRATASRWSASRIDPAARSEPSADSSCAYV